MMGAPPCSCDTFVSVGADAVLLGKNSDRPAFDCQPLRSHPAASHPPDATIQLEYKAIPQAGRTRATLGSSPYWCWGYEMGMNDAGVAIGNEAIFTKELRRLEGQHAAAGAGAAEAPPLGLSGMAVLRLGLERGGSAAEALEIMTALIEEHGQWGSAVPGADHPAVRTHPGHPPPTPAPIPLPLLRPHPCASRRARTTTASSSPTAARPGCWRLPAPSGWRGALAAAPPPPSATSPPSARNGTGAATASSPTPSHTAKPTHNFASRTSTDLGADTHSKALGHRLVGGGGGGQLRLRACVCGPRHAVAGEPHPAAAQPPAAAAEGEHRRRRCLYVPTCIPPLRCLRSARRRAEKNIAALTFSESLCPLAS